MTPEVLLVRTRFSLLPRLLKYHTKDRQCGCQLHYVKRVSLCFSLTNHSVTYGSTNEITQSIAVQLYGRRQVKSFFKIQYSEDIMAITHGRNNSLLALIDQLENNDPKSIIHEKDSIFFCYLYI